MILAPLRLENLEPWDPAHRIWSVINVELCVSSKKIKHFICRVFQLTIYPGKHADRRSTSLFMTPLNL